MGDAQRSQTISAEIREIAERTICDSDGEGPPVLIGENSFGKIRMLAERNPDICCRGRTQEGVA